MTEDDALNYVQRFAKQGEGFNPGAVRVIMGLLTGQGWERHPVPDDVAEARMKDVEGSGLRGPNLWIALKECCGFEFSRLAHRLQNDADALVAEVRADPAYHEEAP